jgi:4-amino-4-deoxy-L-arabinose transferase-like glycosyltransferase
MSTSIENEPEETGSSEAERDDTPDTHVTSTSAIAADTDDEEEESLPPPGAGWLRRLGGLHHVDKPATLAFTFTIMVAAAITLPFLGSIGFFDPWETHYAEVARQMAERDDYLYPYWKKAYFFSKPVLLFWLTAVGYKLVGAGDAQDALPATVELVGRLPNALISLLSIAVIFITVRRLVSTRAAVLSGLVLATTPFWAFMSRQAITDMLYVGPMSMAICLLAMAFFDDERREAQEKARIPIWLLVIFGLGLIPQLWEIGRTGAFLNRVAFAGSETASRLVVSAGLSLLAVAFLFFLHRFARDPLLHGAAFLTALATLGKGPHALLLLGLVYFLYFAVSGDWRFLRRKAMWTTAIALYVFVAAPWFVVMAIFDGRDESRKTWVGRFIMWDLLGRIGGGVHGDRGTFEYYARYLGFGAFPWTPFIPVALLEAARRRLRAKTRRDKSERFQLLIALWATALFVFFTATTTKFHHYIFPVVVPSAILVGCWFDRALSESRRVAAGIVGFIALGMLLVGRDLNAEPWQLVDLFTYHYKSWKPDYYFPTDPNWHVWMSVGTALAFVVFVVGVMSDWAAGAVARGKRNPVAMLLAPIAHFGHAVLAGLKPVRSPGFVMGALLAGFVFAVFSVHVYFNQMSQHWSQRWMFETYYAMKKPGEPIISYQMDWKGETFYGHNEDIQIKKSASDLKKRCEKPGREFVLVQTDRYNRVKSALGKGFEGKVKVVDRSNKKWFLVLVDE